ncbi:MAG: tRNA pseudouridine(55) synthase TruB, partial [Lentisphaeria bacterium]
QNFSNTDKSYRGVMRLGCETTTQDVEGDIIARKDCSDITEEQFESVKGGLVGRIWQTPPMVSAVKKNGKRLYKLARKGQTVEREPREITVHRFATKAFKLPDVEFEVDCSKGTYVRTLCDDIGKELTCGAYLKALRRTAVGDFQVEQAYTTDELKSWEREDLLKHIMPLDKIVELL